jgi:hypothetical protein
MKKLQSIMKLTLISLVFFNISCKKDYIQTINPSGKLIGYWINPIAIDSLWKYERANALIENDYGFIFTSNNLFIERKNSGWCGTPPISYENFEGTWDWNDSIVDIDVPFWGGIANYRWKIISIDNKSLTIYKLREELQEQ